MLGVFKRRRPPLDPVYVSIARDDARSIDWPHIVHVFDRILGVPSAVGPFPDPVSACAFAEMLAHDLLSGGEDLSTLRIEVIPLDSPSAIAG